VSVILWSINIATPAPTPRSLLLPSVYTGMLRLLSVVSSVLSLTLTVSAGCSQYFGFSSLSICYLWMILPIVILYTATASSTLMFIGGIPVIMQSASCEIVRYAFAILKLMSLCTLVH